jgi:capsular polysaccharide biosynthesis protein
MAVAAVYRTLWRHKLFILLLTTALVAATYVMTSRLEKQYTASSLVRIEQQVTQASDVYGSLITGERLARTYALIAKTSSVWRLVRERLPESVPSEAIRIDADQVSNLEVLSLSVTYSDPEIAAQVANAVPGALAEFVRQSGATRETISTLQSAGPPASPSSPNLKLNLTIALLLGLILNSGLVLLIEAFSDRVGGVEDLERATGHPVIAAIPPLHFVATATMAAEVESQMQRQGPRPRYARPASQPEALPDAKSPAETSRAELRRIARRG